MPIKRSLSGISRRVGARIWHRALPCVLLAGFIVAAPPRAARSQPEERFFPFALPWDDTSSGPTDLSAWNHPIRGEPDRLRIGPDGHFYRGNDRVRLFGFDIASGAWPDHAFAETIAARLAKFGVNYVRIAQNSNPVAAGWIDPGTLATLSPEALERLDYFIAQLSGHGIYIHLVVTHFRRAYPRSVPGFAGRATLPEGWPEHGTGVTMFYPPVIEANRALARELLTHKNAYTGFSYAQDPRIAIVEITNEDGLTQVWGSGGLDPIIDARVTHLAPLRDALQARWNQWLQDRYGDDAALRAAWAQGARAGGTDLLINGTFRNGTNGWRLEVREAARAQWQVEHGAGPQTQDALQIRVDRPGAFEWHVNITQDRLQLRDNQPYRVSFWARAARPGAVLTLTLQQSHSPYRTLSSRAAEVTLTDQWQQYTSPLGSTVADANAKLNIFVGKQPQTVWITGIALQEAEVSGLRDGESIPAATVPALKRAEASLRTLRAQRDWMAFLFDVERQFFADSRRFLTEDLNVRAAVVGTQNDFSPATIQSMQDVISVHAYWSHPSFPGRPWDPVNWFVRNSSMVNSRESWNNIHRIAFRRWAGKPLVVDEYNHPQPNTFAAEGFPLAAAYGAFQGWDGMAGWAFREGWGKKWLTQDDWARPLIRGYFAIDQDPVKMLGGWLAAILLRRGDVSPGKELVALDLTDAQEQETVRSVGIWRDFEVIGQGAAHLPLQHRVAVQSGAPQSRRVAAPAGNDPVSSDTGELTWDTRQEAHGVVTVNTPRSKLVIGYGGGRTFTLGEVVIQPQMTSQDGFGVWAVTALDGTAPIGRAHRVILVALGQSQNSNMGWKVYPERRVAGPPPEGSALTLGREWGEPPIQVEGVPARITLPATTARVQAWTLDARGQRQSALEVRVESGRPIVDINPTSRTLWYEVIFGE